MMRNYYECTHYKKVLLSIHHGVMVYAQHLLSVCVLPFLAGFTAVIPPPVLAC